MLVVGILYHSSLQAFQSASVLEYVFFATRNFSSAQNDSIILRSGDWADQSLIKQIPWFSMNEIDDAEVWHRAPYC